MEIKIKKLDPKAVIPCYAKAGDAGMDLTAVNMSITNENNYARIIPSIMLLFGAPSDLDFPYNDVNWPWQDFYVESKLFIGRFDDSGGRITINGFALLTTAYVSWHKYPPI